jgi:hypothetical protein
MPKLIGNLPGSLISVTAIRLIRQSYGDDIWLADHIEAQSRWYLANELSLARQGKITIKRGTINIDASVTDPRVKFVAFYVDNKFRAFTNTKPFIFNWNTHDSPDGEYVVEARGEDENNVDITASRTKIWVDNNRHIAQK